MQRDAKFGLIVGVLLVMVMGVVFTRREPATDAAMPAVSTSKISSIAMPIAKPAANGYAAP